MSLPMVLHIPHASLVIPDSYRDSILLNQSDLLAEQYWATDFYCDELFVLERCQSIVADYSRFVCDVERFRDDCDEIGAQAGNGLFYTHTLRGIELRKPDSVLRDKVLAEVYDPHHTRLTEAVDEALERYGQCLIVDCHSFSDDTIPGEIMPDFCLGTDPTHTPKSILEQIKNCMSSNGYTVRVNYPYSGSIVPMKHYQRDMRVQSVMIEVNKRLYMQGNSTEKSESFADIQRFCRALLQKLAQGINYEIRLKLSEDEIGYLLSFLETAEKRWVEIRDEKLPNPGGMPTKSFVSQRRIKAAREIIRQLCRQIPER